MGVIVTDDNSEMCSPFCDPSQTKSTNSSQYATESAINNNNNNSNATIEIVHHSLSRTKDLIGNAKEFRMENNKRDLRIIGNNNRIRIIQNTGDIQIIGNCTRLKIIGNSGRIKYTGNDGRIYLGSESTQQAVDYIGCNGILKVKNDMSFNSTPPTISSRETTMASKDKPRVGTYRMVIKSASYGGICKNAQWQQLNDLYQANVKRTAKGAYISMPNMKENILGEDSNFHSKEKLNRSKENTYKSILGTGNNVNIVKSYSSIIITNAANINIH